MTGNSLSGLSASQGKEPALLGSALLVRVNTTKPRGNYLSVAASLPSCHSSAALPGNATKSDTNPISVGPNKIINFSRRLASNKTNTHSLGWWGFGRRGNCFAPRRRRRPSSRGWLPRRMAGGWLSKHQRTVTRWQPEFCRYVRRRRVNRSNGGRGGQAGVGPGNNGHKCRAWLPPRFKTGLIKLRMAGSEQVGASTPKKPNINHLEIRLKVCEFQIILKHVGNS